MANIETVYLGLKLKSPIIVASSPLTQNIVSLKECERAGAGAVVLKSIFEEQVENEVNAELEKNDEFLNFSQARNEFVALHKEHLIEKYVNLIKASKKELSIPVIASVCCKSLDSWCEYAMRLQEAGADAIELNYYPVTSDSSIEGATIDKNFDEFVLSARKNIKAPLSIKMGSKYSALAHKIKFIDEAGIDGVVLFNRTWRPDIDVDKMEIVGSSPLTKGTEYGNSLRWVALMSGEVKMDIAANTGIKTGETAVKMLLAGAAAVEVASAIIDGGFSVITEMNRYISSWMDKKGYKTIKDYCGLLAQENREDGYLWERTQFLKTVTGSN